ALHRQVQPWRNLEPVVAKDNSHQIMRKNLWPKGSQRDGTFLLGRPQSGVNLRERLGDVVLDRRYGGIEHARTGSADCHLGLQCHRGWLDTCLCTVWPSANECQRRAAVDGYLTLQPLPMLWQCPLPLHAGQWHPHAILACGAGRGAGWTYSISTSRSR